MTGHSGADSLPEALKGAEVVIIPAGVPRKPGMTRDDLFNINAGIVRTLAEAIAKHAPGVSPCRAFQSLLGRILLHRSCLQELILLSRAANTELCRGLFHSSYLVLMPLDVA